MGVIVTSWSGRLHSLFSFAQSRATAQAEQNRQAAAQEQA